MRSQFVLISDFLATVIKLSFNLRENPGKKNIAQVTESRTNVKWILDKQTKAKSFAILTSSQLKGQEKWEKKKKMYNKVSGFPCGAEEGWQGDGIYLTPPYNGLIYRVSLGKKRVQDTSKCSSFNTPACDWLQDCVHRPGAQAWITRADIHPATSEVQRINSFNHYTINYGFKKAAF